MGKANCLVLSGYGINCEDESKAAFEKAGGSAQKVHVNELIENPTLLHNFNMIYMPGGFSFGDDLGSGKVLANKLKFKLREQLEQFIKDGKLILSICNGFQVAVKLGLLPIPDFKQRVTLTLNDSAKFEDRWVYLRINKASLCVFTKGIEYIALPVRHGEGKFIPADENELRHLVNNHLIVAQYVDDRGQLAGYPWNPNGSIQNIAGICDPTGRIFGMMPHPEAFNDIVNAPFWQKTKQGEAQGLKILKNAVAYLEEKF